MAHPRVQLSPIYTNLLPSARTFKLGAAARPELGPQTADEHGRCREHEVVTDGFAHHRADHLRRYRRDIAEIVARLWRGHGGIKPRSWRDRGEIVAGWITAGSLQQSRRNLAAISS